MPEPGEQPYDKRIENHSFLPFAVSAQWDIDIFTEPSAECDMPSAPEIRGRSGTVRVLEIRRELESKNTSKPDCHQGISEEVEEELHRKSPRTKPCGQWMDSHDTSGHNSVPEGSNLVRQQYFVCKSKHKDGRAPFNFGKVDFTLLVQIIFDFGEADNRTGNQLWEHAEIRCKIQ